MKPPREKVRRLATDMSAPTAHSATRLRSGAPRAVNRAQANPQLNISETSLGCIPAAAASASRESWSAIA